MRSSRFLISLLCLFSVAWLWAQEPSWADKPVASWTEEDAHEVLDSSPWAKLVIAGIAPRQTEAERREGGNMGQPHGIGYDGIDDRWFHPEVLGNPFGGAPRTGPPLPVFRVLVRWESALPVRAAEFKLQQNAPQTLSNEGYIIAVYGVPGRDKHSDPVKLGEPFKELAVLHREGKPDVKPVDVEVFQLENGAAVIYRFPLSAEISTRDTLVEFKALIGRLQVSNVFHLDRMHFRGQLEL